MKVFEVLGELLVLNHIATVSPLFSDNKSNFSVRVIGKDSSLIFKFANTEAAKIMRDELIEHIKEA